MNRARWIVPLVASAVAVGLVALLIVLLLRPRSSAGILFSQRASTAAFNVIVSESPTMQPDSFGFGTVSKTLLSPTYDSAGVTAAGKTMLEAVIADPHVGAVFLQMPSKGNEAGWRAAATLCLQSHVGVALLVTADMKGSHDVQEVVPGMLQNASKLLDSMPGKYKAHLGLAMDIEGVHLTTNGWKGLPKMLDGVRYHTFLFMSPSDASSTGAAEVVQAIDTLCIMQYTSMVKKNLSTDGTVNAKFMQQADPGNAATPTAAQLAVQAAKPMLVGIETTWMTDVYEDATNIIKTKFPDKPCHVQIKDVCASVLEKSFVLGGGIPAGTTPSSFFASAKTQSAYAIHGVTKPTPNLTFFIQEMRPWLQLQHNMSKTPDGWPTGSKSVSESACAQFAIGKAVTGGCSRWTINPKK